MTWEIVSEPHIEGVVNKGDGSFTLPKNETQEPIKFTITYSHDNENKRSAEYILQPCEEACNDFDIIVSDLKCANETNYVEISSTGEIPQSKKNSQLKWKLNTPNSVSNSFLLSSISNGNSVRANLGNVPYGTFNFEWEISGCKDGNKDLTSDGLCYNFAGGNIISTIYGQSTKGTTYGIQSADIQYKLVRKNGNSITDLFAFKPLKISVITAQGKTISAGSSENIYGQQNCINFTASTEYPNIDPLYEGSPSTAQGKCDCTHIYNNVKTISTKLDFNEEIRNIEFDGFTIDDVFFEMKIGDAKGRCDFSKNGLYFGNGCQGCYNMPLKILNETESNEFSNSLNKHFEKLNDGNYISIKSIASFSKENVGLAFGVVNDCTV